MASVVVSGKLPRMMGVLLYSIVDVKRIRCHED